MSTVQIQTADFEGAIPVYTKYDGEYLPNNAYVYMHENGDIGAHNRNGGPVPAHVWSNRTLEFSVPANSYGPKLLAAVQSLLPKFQALHDGYESEWDGASMARKLTPETTAICEEIQEFFRTFTGTVDVCTGKEFAMAGDSNADALRRLWPDDLTLRDAAQNLKNSAELADWAYVDPSTDWNAVLLDIADNLLFSRGRDVLEAIHIQELHAADRVTSEQLQEMVQDGDLDPAVTEGVL